jgi:hypothetical protein
VKIGIRTKMLPAGEERLRMASERRGREGDDPELPARRVQFSAGGKMRTVWVGPVYPGGPEENLWELDLEA